MKRLLEGHYLFLLYKLIENYKNIRYRIDSEVHSVSRRERDLQQKTVCLLVCAHNQVHHFSYYDRNLIQSQSELVTVDNYGGYSFQMNH